jgi:hypothetical protein
MVNVMMCNKSELVQHERPHGVNGVTWIINQHGKDIQSYAGTAAPSRAPETELPIAADRSGFTLMTMRKGA